MKISKLQESFMQILLIKKIVRDELVIILDPLALSVKSDFSAGYGSLDP